MGKAQKKGAQPTQRVRGAPMDSREEVVDRLIGHRVDQIKATPEFKVWPTERQVRFLKAYTENFKATHGFEERYSDAEMSDFRRVLLNRGEV